MNLNTPQYILILILALPIMAACQPKNTATHNDIQDIEIKHSKAQLDDSEYKINFVKKIYEDELNDDLMRINVIKLHASQELKHLIDKTDEISAQDEEMCDWVRTILIPGNDRDTRLENIKVSMQDNGLVRADFYNFGEKHQVDFDIQCDANKCKISDIYDPNSYKQELENIIKKGICITPDTEDTIIENLSTGKDAICQIDQDGSTLYKGKCLFEPQSEGSFYISHPNIEKNVMVEGLMVIVENKDHAVVQATKIGGGGSIWGEAIRSQKEKACWLGDNFKICAW